MLRDLRAALRVLVTGADRRLACRVAAIALVVLAGGLLTGAGPLALKGLIDATGGLAEGRQALPESVAGYAAAYLAALVGSRLLGELRPALVGTTEQLLYAGLKQRYFAHLLDLPLSYHLGRRTGAVVHSLEQAIGGYQVLAHNLVNSAIPVIVELATVAVVIVSLHQPLLEASFAATALAYLAVMGYCSLRMHDGSDAITEANLGAHAMLMDSLLNCETIKCYNAEPAIGGRYAGMTQQLYARWRHWHRTRMRMGLALGITFAIAMAASLGVAIHATAQGTLSVGGLVLVNVYLLQVMRPLEMLGAAARDMSQALAFLRPMIAILEEIPEPTRSEKTLATPRKPVGINFHDVTFSYDEQEPVLQAFSLDIAPGRSVAIVGSSGSGKSSLVRLLLRLYDPKAGRILVDGRDIAKLAAADVRAMIGLVPQDTVLFNDTIAFNIGIGLAGAVQQDIEQAARLAGLHDFIRRLPEGYATVVGERGLKVSGGERQRIAIARAVLKRPRIYVFDEATSMLDTVTEQAILRNLRTVSAGCTTITVAHRLSTARHADEIVVLAQGQVVEQGDHASLLARSDVYARLWQAQLRGACEHASPP